MKTVETQIPDQWMDDLKGICEQFGLEVDRVFQMMIYRVIVNANRLPDAMAEYEEAAAHGDGDKTG